MTSLATPPRTFVTGGSGFVGRALVASADRPLRALVHRTPIGNGHETIQGDLLASETPWAVCFDGMERLLHAARPSSNTDRGRRRVAKRTAVANEAMLTAAEASGVHALAVHGSLSYGECGGMLVTPDAPVNPIGYAQAYAIGEAPWRDRIGPSCTVVRAPWILGQGSWFPMLYGGRTVPLFGDGNMWMSVVDMDAFAPWLWTVLDAAPGGVVHPPLLARCRQRDFAEAVATLRGVEVVPWSENRTKRTYGRQAAASMFASLRMDDGRGDASEQASSLNGLQDVLQSVLVRS